MESKTLNFISASFLILILICFFLPFISITCANTEIAKLKGTDLAFGTEIKFQERTEKLKPELFALLAFFLTIIGIIISTIALLSKQEKQKNFQIALSITSLLIFISTLALKFKLDPDVELTGLKLEYKTPYWITLISSILIPFLNVFFIFVKSNQENNTKTN